MLVDAKVRVRRLIVALAVATSSCATSYTPRPSHRLAFTESGATLRLTSDAGSFSIWDVDRAVATDPVAKAEALTYVHRTRTGLVLDLAGVGMIVGGGALLHPSSARTRQDVGAGLMLGGLVSITAALVLLTTGIPHLYDAINIYNDDLPPDLR